MSKRIQGIRGMNDILPDQTALWQYIERKVEAVLEQYGYQEIRLPVLESTDLFKRSVGEVTDIVEKEMYTFDDRNGDSVTLRPEGTAGCVRAGEQHGLFYNQQQRLWYRGPMFRYERPQKGRYRQFHQMGVESFGMAGPDIDAELILLSQRLWLALGIAPWATLQLNTIGSSDSRKQFGEALLTYLNAHKSELDPDSQRRLENNPLRILDSKDANTQALLDNGPSLSDFIDDESKVHFEQLCKILDRAGVNYQVNTRLVRGLDYYGKTVFEWVTDKLGAQGTICAGGRYDGLVSHLGGKPTPAVGFAIGLERLVLLVEQLDLGAELKSDNDIYIMPLVPEAMVEASALGELLRSELVGLKVMNHCGGGSVKSQMKKADKSGARWALMIGEEELKQNQVVLKPLRSRAEQKTVAWDEVVTTLKDLNVE